MYNTKKLQKALDSLERKANYVNMEYYYPKYEKLLKIAITIDEIKSWYYLEIIKNKRKGY